MDVENGQAMHLLEHRAVRLRADLHVARQVSKVFAGQHLFAPYSISTWQLGLDPPEEKKRSRLYSLQRMISVLEPPLLRMRHSLQSIC
jgi:hypothetical protein